MDVLPLNFRTCKYCGIWSNKNNYYIPRSIYKFFIIFVIVQFTISEMIVLVTAKGTLSDLTEILFMFFTYAALCLKIFNFILRQDEMSSLLSDFRSPLYQPKSPEEKEITLKYSKSAARVYKIMITLAQSTGMVLCFVPLLSTSMDDLYLPFKSYQPYDISKSVNFWITYFLQFLALYYGVFLNVSLDTMAYGFIILATGQYELNCHRLTNSTISIKYCIEHHVLIQNSVLKIKKIFICVIVPLFCFSLITLCTSIFLMSQKKVLTFEFLSLVMYLACMLFQIFFYCWFGNELELRIKVIMDAIYASKWFELPSKERRNRWFVMLCTPYYSGISFHGQCGLTLQTFLWILKTSYASFNLLQRASIEKID